MNTRVVTQRTLRQAFAGFGLPHLDAWQIQNLGQKSKNQLKSSGKGDDTPWNPKVYLKGGMTTLGME
jgi:hypothetical protein